MANRFNGGLGSGGYAPGGANGKMGRLPKVFALFVDCPAMPDILLRAIADADRAEVAELIYASINFWYRTHGAADIFRGGPSVTEVFFDVYNDLTPGCNVVAVNPQTGRLMGSCFYHPRPQHVGLGIMAVHPNYVGQGVGSAILRQIIEFARQQRKPLRLTGMF